MSSRTLLEVEEAPSGGWRNACVICGATPTRWKMELPEPDHKGRLTAAFCEQHEINKDMLVAAMAGPEER